MKECDIFRGSKQIDPPTHFQRVHDPLPQDLRPWIAVISFPHSGLVYCEKICERQADGSTDGRTDT